MSIPKREQLGNNAFTTLDGSINNSVTSITVTDGSVFPAAGNFRVTVSDEIMLCTARSGNTLTVVRGYEGTGNASHTDLDNITANLTQGSLDRWAQDNDALWGYASRPPVGVISDGVGGLLTSASFTWVNQGGASVSDQNGTILLRAPFSGGGENARILKKAAPGTPWTLIAAIEANALADGIPNFGVVARQSSSGKFFIGTVQTDPSSTNVYCYAAYTLASATAFNATILARSDGKFTPFGKYFWFKLTDDGTDLKFYGSVDGFEWFLLVTHDRDSYMTSGGPDEFGFYVNNQGSSLYDMTARLVHWSHS